MHTPKLIPVLNVAIAGHRTERLLSADAQMVEIGKTIQRLLQQIRDNAERLLPLMEDIREIYEPAPVDQSKDIFQLRVITGLAEGTDRLAVQNAPGIADRILMVLADDPLLYHDAEAIHLIKTASKAPFTITGTGNTTTHLSLLPFGAARHQGEAPPEAYRTRDEFVITHADILIAVWDGQQPKGIAGGTVRMIRHALQLGTPVLWINPRQPGNSSLSKPASSPYTHINLASHETPPTERFWTPGDRLDEELQATIKQILHPFAPTPQINQACRPNQWAGYFDRLFQGIATLDWKKIADSACLRPVVSSYQQPVFKSPNYKENRLPHAIAYFDKRAQIFAGHYRSTYWLCYLMAAFAIWFAALGFAHEKPTLSASLSTFNPFGLMEAVIILTIIMLVNRAASQSYHSQFIDSRYSAELLRFHRLLHPICGVSNFLNTPRPSAPLHTEDKKSLFSKILESICTLRLASHQHHPRPTTQFNIWWVSRLLADELICGLEHMNRDQKTWLATYQAHANKILQEQIDYHQKREQAHEALHRHLHCLTNLLFACTLLAAGIHLLHAPGNSGESHFLALLTISLPAFGAACHGILTQSEAMRIAQRSQQMHRALKQLLDELNAACPDTTDSATGRPWLQWMQIREAVTHAANLMIEESTDWHQLISSREVTLPA